MKIQKYLIESRGPLLQHDDKTANPLNEYTRQLKAISGKRKKTDEDFLEMARIEWMAGLYHTPSAGYYLKAECLEASLREASRSKKLGKIFREAVTIPDNPVFHFEHEHLSPEELFEMEEYRDFRTIKIQRAKVMRCRPLFRNWHCEAEIWYEEARVDKSELTQMLEYAGRYIGICDYRPKFGRFSATEIK